MTYYFFLLFKLKVTNLLSLVHRVGACDANNVKLVNEKRDPDLFCIILNDIRICKLLFFLMPSKGTVLKKTRKPFF